MIPLPGQIPAAALKVKPSHPAAETALNLGEREIKDRELIDKNYYFLPGSFSFNTATSSFS